MVKLLWFDGIGISLYAKWLEAGKFVWPASATSEAVAISAVQLGYLLDAPEVSAGACPIPTGSTKTRCRPTGTKTIHYIYDFGDNWNHVIKVEKIDDAPLASPTTGLDPIRLLAT